MNTPRQNFIYPHIKHETRVFGAVNRIGEVINESGDWREYLPPETYQKVGSVESSACYIYAQTHTIATILEKQYGIKDSDFAERFNALLSNGSPYGGDPLAGAESFQKDGLIKYDLMPFLETLINSWEDFHSWKGADREECLLAGQEFRKQWKLNYGIAFERDHSIEMKYHAIREYLQRSPMPMSVYGKTDNTGNYVPKQPGITDTHMVEAVYLDNENCIWVWDTYSPQLKKLPANYNPDFGMFWGVTKVLPSSREPWWMRLYKLFFR